MDLPLRQKTCRHCSRLFAICAACDRGHAYCTPRCRAAGRRRSLQAARARHQQSPEGRLDHRDQQRAYRDRRRVMDQSSTTPRRSTRLPVPDAAPVRPPTPTRCVVCGRSSRWLVPMREPRIAVDDGQGVRAAAQPDDCVVTCTPALRLLSRDPSPRAARPPLPASPAPAPPNSDARPPTPAARHPTVRVSLAMPRCGPAIPRTPSSGEQRNPLPPVIRYPVLVEYRQRIIWTSMAK